MVLTMILGTVNVSNNAGSSFKTALAVSGNNVHVLWDDNTPGNSDILYRRSLDNGTTFPNIIKNLSSSPGFSNSAAIAVSGSNPYVVWGDSTLGSTEIIYRTSANNGDTFPSLLTNLSASDGASFSPAIATS